MRPATDRSIPITRAAASSNVATRSSRPGSQANGDVAARALGIAPAAFTHVAHAEDDDQPAQRQMQTALWPATLGYFLDQRLFGLLGFDDLGRVRRHFIDFVRATGPLPTLRIGRQPYGLLPVTALNRWQPIDPADVGARATAALRSVREAFRRSMGGVPRVTETTNPVQLDRELMDVLRMLPASNGYGLRHAFGPNFVDNFWSFLMINMDANWWNQQQQSTQPSISVPGLPTLTPQGTSVFAPWLDRFGGPLVQAGSASQPGPELPLCPRERGSERPAGWRGAGYGEAAVVLAAPPRAVASLRVRRRPPAPAQQRDHSAQRQDPELIDMTSEQTPTFARQLARPVSSAPGAPSIGAFLDNPANANQADALELGELRTSLNGLAGRKPQALEGLLVGTLDLASHRLDAWITSLATRRLAALRTTRSGATFFGGYGWVEDLRPQSGRTSDGFIHAPSIAQASAAAVLASAHLSHRVANGNEPFALDLSSERVHRARGLIDGVRQGQSLPALLGYRLERSLHGPASTASSTTCAPPPAGLDTCGAAPRRPSRWPPRTSSTAWTSWPATTVAKPSFKPSTRSWSTTTSTASGTSLTRSRTRSMAWAICSWPRASSRPPRGSVDRTSATLESIVRGETVAVPEVLDTPRSGIGLTHRVVSLIGAAVQIPGFTHQPRSLDEPFLQ